MAFDFYSYIHFVFVGFIALFPVVNPLGSAFIVSPYFSNLSNRGRKNAVKKIVFYVFIMCCFVLLSGRRILALFGISVPIIQLAGGIMICKIGWDFLSPSKAEKAVNSSDGDEDLIPEATINSKLFFPITFPITAGAGAIAVLITLSAQASRTGFSKWLIDTSSILLAVIGICILVFIC